MVNLLVHCFCQYNPLYSHENDSDIYEFIQMIKTQLRKPCENRSESPVKIDSKALLKLQNESPVEK